MSNSKTQETPIAASLAALDGLFSYYDADPPVATAPAPKPDPRPNPAKPA